MFRTVCARGTIKSPPKRAEIRRYVYTFFRLRPAALAAGWEAFACITDTITIVVCLIGIGYKFTVVDVIPHPIVI